MKTKKHTDTEKAEPIEGRISYFRFNVSKLKITPLMNAKAILRDSTKIKRTLQIDTTQMKTDTIYGIRRETKKKGGYYARLNLKEY